MKRDYPPTRTWKTGNPETLKIAPKKLTELEQTISLKYRNINGILAVKEGEIVFEKYFNGKTADDTHNVASVTKSVTSALIGIAVDKRYIKDIDQKVLDFFPEYQTKPGDTVKRSITIKHLLTMTAPTTMRSAASGNEALDRLRRQPDWCRFVLDQLGRAGKPQGFYYSTSNMQLLSAIITRTSGLCAREFANVHLFKPIGIREIPDNPGQTFTLDDIFVKHDSGWIKDPQGNSAGGFGLALRLRDMARFGSLYVNEGRWDKRHVIPKEWVRASIQNHSGDYGYLWWLKKEKGLFVFSARGDGGNGIWCIPEQDLVIATVGSFLRRPKDPWELIQEYMLNT